MVDQIAQALGSIIDIFVLEDVICAGVKEDDVGTGGERDAGCIADVGDYPAWVSFVFEGCSALGSDVCNFVGLLKSVVEEFTEAVAVGGSGSRGDGGSEGENTEVETGKCTAAGHLGGNFVLEGGVASGDRVEDAFPLVEGCLGGVIPEREGGEFLKGNVHPALDIFVPTSLGIAGGGDDFGICGAGQRCFGPSAVGEPGCSVAGPGVGGTFATEAVAVESIVSIDELDGVGQAVSARDLGTVVLGEEIMLPPVETLDELVEARSHACGQVLLLSFPSIYTQGGFGTSRGRFIKKGCITNNICFARVGCDFRMDCIEQIVHRLSKCGAAHETRSIVEESCAA